MLANQVEPELVFAEKSVALKKALEAAVSRWIIVQFSNRVGPNYTSGLLASAEEVDTNVQRRLTEVFKLQALEQQQNPLQIIREELLCLNNFLQEAGVKTSERDEVQKQMYPNDHFDFSTITFSDFGDVAAEAGLHWGAAKAFVALNRES